MTTRQAFSRRHPLLTYYLLTFGISWGALLFMMARTGMPTSKGQMEAILPVAIVAMLLGPSASALLSIGLVDGKAGFADLRARLGKWRVGVTWYAIAILLAPITILIVLMTLSTISPDYLPGLLTRDDKLARLTMGIVAALVTGLCEELGWTGMVTPRLRQRHGVFATGLIVGVLWGLWHLLPMVILPSGVYAAPASPTVYIALRTLSFLVGSLVAFRVLMVWVYEHTQSLLLIVIMHAALTAANIIYEPEAIGGASLFLVDFVTAAAFWLLVAAVAIVNHGQFGRRQVYGEMGVASR